MKAFVVGTFILLLFAVLSATPRGLTSRDIDVDGTVTELESQIIPVPPNPLIGEPQNTASKDWQQLSAETLDVMLPAGEQWGTRYNHLAGNPGTFSSLGTLQTVSSLAVNRAPVWIRRELRNTLLSLTFDKQLLWANTIISTPDPWVDEVAFCIATSSPEYLNSSFADPMLFLENAQWIYSIAAELPYVEIVDTGSATSGGDYWSTTRYWKKDASGVMLQVEVPQDIYYWYLVQPKITDEIAAYIDPNIVESNTTHSNNIVAPPTGKFWRSYIYDLVDGDYPVLSDTLTLCQTAFNRDGSAGDAIRAIIWWINHNMSFTSNNERPHQPVRIIEKRIGRCGEYADLTAAVSRLALIPCNSISSISTDHTWNEFWEDGWVSWEPVNGYVNDPLVYENGWGKVFGSVFEERCDGLMTPVTERYSEGLATINIQVVDADLQPVDAARVILAIFETTPRFDCQQFTDNNGMVSFQVGENRDYRARAETFFGLYPANPGTYTQLVSNSVDGEVYNYQFQIAAPIPQPMIEALAAPADPTDDYRFQVAFSSPGYYIRGITLWDDIDVLGVQPRHYKRVDQPASVAFMVTDADNQLFMQLDNMCSAYSYLSPSVAGTGLFNIPLGQDWYAFADNSHRHGNAVMISGSLSYEAWSTALDDPQVPSAVFQLSQPSPNPMRSETKITLDLSSPMDVKMDVCNLRGQIIRTIQTDRLPQGRNNISWDGADDSGKTVASGVYLLRVEGAGVSVVRKVVLTR